MTAEFAEPPRLVVFDAGGVIVRLAQFWDEVVARAGVTPSADLNDESFRAAHTEVARAHQLGTIETDEYLERVAGAAGLTIDEAEALLAAHIVEEYPGLDRVIDCLNEHRIPTALLSNTNAFHWRQMRPEAGEPVLFPVIGRLDRHFGSHLFGLMKPDAAIYAALEVATQFSGRDILFFDDLAANVAAAQAHGWSAIQIDPSGSPADQILGELAHRGVRC